MQDRFGVSGHIKVFSVNEKTDEKKFLFEQENTIQVSWGNIVAQLLRGNSEYILSTMYLEFENNAGAVTNPTYTAYAGRDYYAGLSDPNDYIRSSLIQTPKLEIVSGYEDYFTEGTSGNQLVFYAQTSGTTGENGTTFGSGSNSKVIGAALVATPTPADKTQDLIFSRTYFDAANHIAKDATSQIGISWTIKLTI